jgi:3-isopropylmalate/(R)-2-methylmalate dehydratase small subunit
MQPFQTLISRAAVLPGADIDTDIIFPARFLLHTDKAKLGDYAFYDWRLRGDGSENPDFPLNQPQARGAEILVTGKNFGCGSSREHAPWAIAGLGVRCLIAESFGEIFAANCLRNGILALALDGQAVAALTAAARAGETFIVDLEAQTLRAGETAYPIAPPPRARLALLNGWNETAMILNTQSEALDAFDRAQRAAMPWLFQSDNAGYAAEETRVG